ncbi:MAG: RDD family protein [Cryobacterium sp.]|uniref:RDD family protein n=1 Tax=unclassified Cryobacterium TaxID=2649013 RepID=UPI0018CAA0B8|nr:MULTISPECIES: RDD family protein [unclassified Cryobacterium]MCY7404925.1 RDD family protein [Cryobacterium sp.]MEC5153237.1 putative RDD family membrane protein YckC [Cryobacterium sp. CAN_C3]
MTETARPTDRADSHSDDLSRDDELVTGEAVALDVRPASVILRAAGSIIDTAAYVALYLLFVLAFFLGLAESTDAALTQALSIAALVFSLLIVPVLVETLTHGRSLGKLAIGARIVRDDGGAISLRHAFIRGLTGVLEIIMTLGGLAATTALLNGRSKRLGDLLAGTYSQHERVQRNKEVPRPLPEALVPWSQTVDIARLPDRLARRVAQYLRQSSHLTPLTRERLAQTLAAEVTPFVSPLPDAPAEFFLVGVAAVRRDREYTALLLERERLARLSPVLTGLPHGFPDR